MLIKVMKLFLGATNCLSDIPNSVHWLSFFNFLPSGHSLLYVSFEFDINKFKVNFTINRDFTWFSLCFWSINIERKTFIAVYQEYKTNNQQYMADRHIITSTL